VDRETWSSPYDGEVDVAPRGGSVYTEPIEDYRRLVANPLLTVAGCVLGVVLIRYGLAHRVLAPFLAGLAMIPGAFFFSQFHCLDCGATGWLLGAGRHICPPLVVRWREGRAGRWRFPRLKAQMILWLYFLASVTGLLLILFALSK
jgi:hypothetical protein